jgi:hypothetical protein
MRPSSMIFWALVLAFAIFGVFLQINNIKTPWYLTIKFFLFSAIYFKHRNARTFVLKTQASLHLRLHPVLSRGLAGAGGGTTKAPSFLWSLSQSRNAMGPRLLRFQSQLILGGLSKVYQTVTVSYFYHLPEVGGPLTSSANR